MNATTTGTGFAPFGTFTPAAPEPWDQAAAIAAMAEVQAVLEARSISPDEPRFRPLCRRTVAALQADDLAGVRAACRESVRVLQSLPEGSYLRHVWAWLGGKGPAGR